jgi:hypothetical protein|tara:strand:- start:577 stop:1545 length:969 start_codon:yes stop_codon:yes gene_type:complete
LISLFDYLHQNIVGQLDLKLKLNMPAVSDATPAMNDKVARFVSMAPPIHGYRGKDCVEGQSWSSFITEFFDDDDGFEDLQMLAEIHVARFKCINLGIIDLNQYPVEEYALTKLARMPVNRTLTNIKAIVGELPEDQDWVRVITGGHNIPGGTAKECAVGLWRLLAISYYCNCPTTPDSPSRDYLQPHIESCEYQEEDDYKPNKPKKIKKTNKTKKQEEINMDMIKEFISKATSDQIKEISKSCMDRQEGLSAFERLAEDSEPIAEEEESEEEYECPEGWIEEAFEGETIWEHEETSEICKPCENVEEAPKGKWNDNCDAIIW